MFEVFKMELGWIDFSKDDRDKVLGVLDLLSEPGVLDELGIAPIRDKFSDLFFPGTSTIQRRAKYFLIVPYALKDLALNYELPQINLDTLNRIEMETAIKLDDNNSSDEWGIIGRDAIRRGNWVQLPPSRIYLAGLKRYNIFNYKSLNHYIGTIQKQKIERNLLESNVNQDEGGNVIDDENAGRSIYKHDLFISDLYSPKWKDNLSIHLTVDEAKFLKQQIFSTCKDSLMAQILKSDNVDEIIKFTSFYDLKDLIYDFTEEIQNDYYDAISFSNFNYALRVIYNMIISKNENQEACDEFKKLNFDELSKVNIDSIMKSHNIVNVPLNTFLNKSKECMMNGDLEGLKKLISKREQDLKGPTRSKTLQPPVTEWFAGRYLDYRFSIGIRIIEDIYNGLNNGSEVHKC